VIGSLNTIKKVVNVKGYVNSAPDFHDQPKVMNGASELLLDIFGESGKHTRCALGTSNLPSNIPVEVEMIVEV
jgi:enamine deaminase RidA (YjgF/YER057c/UK114 family)